MSPVDHDVGPNYELPRPQAEPFRPASESLPEQGVAQPERQSLSVEYEHASAGAGIPQVPIAPASQDAPFADPVSTDHASLVTPNATLTASDSDLIEKEWVTRAKAIVEQTHDDPHKQNDELTKIKAEYLKQRYDKDIKISED